MINMISFDWVVKLDSENDKRGKVYQVTMGNPVHIVNTVKFLEKSKNEKKKREDKKFQLYRTSKYIIHVPY